jgi:hypothetical protein
MRDDTETEPVFCVNCKHYRADYNDCIHVKNIRLVQKYDLVTGILLANPKYVLNDSAASTSRTGEAKDTNCGYQGGWFEALNILELAKKSIS